MTQFKTLVKENWKSIAIIVGVVAVITTVIAVVLTVAVGSTPPDTSTGTSTFNGPLNMNGRLGSADANSFAQPLVLANPYPNSIQEFGRRFFTHAAGYHAVVGQSTSDPNQEYVYIYETDADGVAQRTTTLQIPNTYHVMHGAFAPYFNFVDENYYLFLSVGPRQGEVTTAQIYATHLICASVKGCKACAMTPWSWATLSADAPLATETLGGYVIALKHPFYTWVSSTPYIGTFGDVVQVQLDSFNTTGQKRHSLYVRGSEWDADQPGGALFWLTVLTNSKDPTLRLNQTIQDAKLLALRTQSDDGKTPEGYTPYTKTASDYANGFGSSFVAGTDQNSDAILLVANSTAEDYSPLADYSSGTFAAPKGYVQGYKLTNFLWTQTFDTYYQYRYPGLSTDTGLEDGWCNTVGWFEGKVVTCPAESDSNGNATFLIFKWEQDPVHVDKLVQVSGSPITFGGADAFPKTNLYRATFGSARRMNVVMDTLADGSILLSTFYSGQGNVIDVRQAVTWKDLQRLGVNYNTGGYAPVLDYYGAAQFTYHFTDATGLQMRLSFCDPNFENQGQCVILSKNRS